MTYLTREEYQRRQQEAIDANGEQIFAAAREMHAAAVAAIRAKVPSLPAEADEPIRAMLIYTLGCGREIGAKAKAERVVPIINDNRDQFVDIAKIWDKSSDPT